MVDPNDKKLLELAISKQLVDKKIATEVFHRARKEERSAAELLVEIGALPRHTLEALKWEMDLAIAPDAIAGFRILRKIGQGGMGSVYLAEQLSLKREVALKVISPQFAANAQAVDRFMREARTAAVVNHPNVISVIDVGFNGGHLYMALELVSGGDAAQLAARTNGILPEARALEIISDCCRGLEALNEAHLIHRDIKPANIFITKHGIAKLADLGLARSAQGDEGLTVFGHAVGTPAFMSPEQANGKENVDIRADIYSLGASLFALTTGNPPFSGNGAYAIVAKVLTEPAPDPRSVNPALSGAICQIISRCMSKRPADRFQTPQELAVAVADVLAASSSAGLRTGTSVIRAMTSGGRSGTSVIHRPTTDRTTRTHTHHTPPTARVHKTKPVAAKRPSRGVSLPLIAGVLAVAAVVLMVGMSGKSSTSASTQSASSTSGTLPAVAETKVAETKAAQPSPTVDPSRPSLVESAAQPSAVSVASRAPVIAGLVAYWPLDEGSGLKAGDTSGGQSTGTISGATWEPGKLGSAVSFSKPSKILCGNADSLASVDEITVMFWIKTKQNFKGQEPVSVVRHDGHFTALQLAPDGNAHVATWAGGHVNVATFPWHGAWDDGRWHHYAVTYHRSEGLMVYKDGQLFAQDKNLTGPLPAKTSAPFILGASELNCEYFAGALDEVRVFDRQLSVSEITALAAIAEK